MNAIFSRRSIRKYTKQDISEEIIEKIIRAGMAAPSAGNEQPWHFIVINDRSVLNEIPKFHPYAKMLAEVDNAIVICGDLTLEKYEGFWVQDCSAATQNMLLMVHDLGLGSVWLGVYPIEERVKALKELLGLPENIIPFSVLPIGHPAESKEPANRFSPSKVHRNRW
ncbi:MAG: nitroreductase family protein [Clostridia bacterium]|nr:nitroreductase family protein [Clostridia bacterium]